MPEKKKVRTTAKDKVRSKGAPKTLKDLEAKRGQRVKGGASPRGTIYWG